VVGGTGKSDHPSRFAPSPLKNRKGDSPGMPEMLCIFDVALKNGGLDACSFVFYLQSCRIWPPSHDPASMTKKLRAAKPLIT
jgi:hypothetical protein